MLGQGSRDPLLNYVQGSRLFCDATVGDEAAVLCQVAWSAQTAAGGQGWRPWRRGNGVGHINKVKLRRARLGWDW